MIMKVGAMEKGKSSQEKKKVSLVKKRMLDEVDREFTSAKSAFFSRFDRLTVADMSELRRSLKKVSKRTLVVKHTLAKKIFDKLQVPDGERLLNSSVLVTLGIDEPQLTSKVLVEFVKGHENVELKGLILDKKVYDASFVRELAKLPTRKELLTLTVTWMKAPLTNLAVTLGGILRSFVSVLNEVQKKKAQEVSH